MNKLIENKELKAIMHSKRANIYYLEKCRVMQKDGRVVFLTESASENYYWNIPIANTTVILLGIGTSITQAAVRMLSSAGVLIGFTGNGGTPLISADDVEWFAPSNEYRPTEYVQKWCSFWFDDTKRLSIAKLLQKKRCEFLQKVWDKDTELQNYGFYSDDDDVEKALVCFDNATEKAGDIAKLLLAEAKLTKNFYKYAANNTDIDDFVRNHDGNDVANRFLNHGNYLAYGLAATSLWVLGIPHGFAVMHGKTRRGALVFDIADLIKDAIVLPWAFVCAESGMNQSEFRQVILNKFIEHKAMDYMFDTIKQACRYFD